ncbi:hypothetical protein [Halomarina rubra]|uniref:Small CPxCG-related zinc finger protein n=1 Tax=Halomarina rubra TaxID=2071873 RepID=A0ABD6B198_9EURY|nr:hypothetical protein [Halomarina rubra]
MTWRLYCPDCQAEGETDDRHTLDWLLCGHEERHEGHAPDYVTIGGEA